MEYRLSTHTGNIFTKEEFFSLYKDQYSILDHKTLTSLWNDLTPIEVEDGMDVKELQDKMRFIYRSNGYNAFYAGCTDTLVRDPTRLLKLIPKAPKKDGM